MIGRVARYGRRPFSGGLDAAHRFIQPLTARASLALRVALLTTAAVAVTLAAVSALVYVTVRAEFESSLDESMLRRANAAVTSGYTPSAEELDVVGIKIFVVRGGQIFSRRGDTATLPLDHHETEVSIGQAKSSRRTTELGGEPYRVIAVQAGEGSALVLAQPMESIQRALERLKIILLLASAAGVVVAGGAGWVVATNGLRPVRRLTAATERVARTAELHPITVHGHDELARLTASFNQMLLALDASQHRQRQLVADAGHELRTPLTSLRTNIELLWQAADNPERHLAAGDRTEIMNDVRAQLQELTTLVGDLVELARDEPMARNPGPLDLADTVASAVDRVRLRAPTVTFDVKAEPWTVIGEPSLLERAVTNLLDNAAKWSPSGGTVTTSLRDGVLSVGDEGPGIADEDLPHVFERFYRSAEARTLPGSGLGLAIVRHAVERHGGTVTAARAPEGGTLMVARFPSSHPLG
jgi:two-component system sensor histidine kinase MprB